MGRGFKKKTVGPVFLVAQGNSSPWSIEEVATATLVSYQSGEAAYLVRTREGFFGPEEDIYDRGSFFMSRGEALTEIRRRRDKEITSLRKKLSILEAMWCG